MSELLAKLIDCPEKSRKVYSEKVAQRLEQIRLTPKVKSALRLYAAGINKDAIVKGMDISLGHLENAIISPVGKMYIKLIMQEHEQKFQMLFGKVVNYISDGLDSSGLQDRDRAAKLWTSMSGRLVSTVQIIRTAEDNVRDLLEGKAIDAEYTTVPAAVQEGHRNTLQHPQQEGGDSSLSAE